MKTSITWFSNLLKDESGQDLIEYALVAGVIGLGAIALLPGIGTKVTTLFSNLSNALPAS